MPLRSNLRRARDRWRLAASVPRLSRRVAWTGVKLLGAMAVAEAVRRARAGPLGARVGAPATVLEGDAFFVEARVESPFPLVELDAYFGGRWERAGAREPGVRVEKWVFTAAGAGLRPVVVRARDAEGHALARTRWVLVLPARAAPLLPGRRLAPFEARPGAREAEAAPRAP